MFMSTEAMICTGILLTSRVCLILVFECITILVMHTSYRLLDSLVVECWLRVREVPGFNPQSRTASYQGRYKNDTSSSLVWHSTLKRQILALSQELR